MKFLSTNHISNNIKHYQYFYFISSILFNTLADIFHIIWVLNEGLEIFKIFYTNISVVSDCNTSFCKDYWHTDKYFQYLIDGLLDSIVHLFFLNQSRLLLVSSKDSQEFTANVDCAFEYFLL